MTKFDIILIASTATFVSTFGVFVIILKIKQYTHAPVNVLRRENQDIELQNVIDPINSNLRDVDLSSLPQYPTSQAIINQLPIRWPENYLPRYSELSENIINSPLEFEIAFAWDFLPWLKIFFSILPIFIIIFKDFRLIELIYIIPSSVFQITNFNLLNKYIFNEIRQAYTGGTTWSSRIFWERTYRCILQFNFLSSFNFNPLLNDIFIKLKS